MPELPEVEITCLGIREALIGRKIKEILVRQPRLRWPVPTQLTELKNVDILAIYRRAKYILLATAQGTIIIHLGMSGRLCVVEKSQPCQKHDHADFVLENGKVLRYTDPRRFGAILWTSEDPLNYPLLKNLGIEPFSEQFNHQYLFEKIKHKKTTIKQLIMDQQVVVGVGNIYANEALFASKISPLRLSNSLTKGECKRLVDKIQMILQKAITRGGTTLRDFLSPLGTQGYFVQELFVYGREGKKCFKCKKPLQATRINQRSTVFCDTCQR